jgi:hypothetical protein
VAANVDLLHVKRIHLVGFVYIVIGDSRKDSMHAFVFFVAINVVFLTNNIGPLGY